MKKKGLLLMLMILLIVSLIACNTSDSSDNGKNNADDIPQGGESVSGVLYAKGTSLDFVFVDAELASFANELFYAIGTNLSGNANIKNTDSDTPAEHEIVIGKTNREISQKAYERLERMESSSKYEVPYLIYSDGNSVAIAYAEDDLGRNSALIMACDVLIELVGESEDSTSAGRR